MNTFLVYNFSGEVDEISHLFPSERFAKIAAIAAGHGKSVTVRDLANFQDLADVGPDFMKLLGELSFHDRAADYDALVNREAAFIADGGFDVVFLNLWHGTGFKFTMDMLTGLRELAPDIRVFGIGPKVDWFNEHILTLTGSKLNGLVTGLGYNAVDAIVRGLPLDQTPNLMSWHGGTVRKSEKATIDADKTPPPLYDDAVYRHLDRKVPVYSITLSNQACPNRCVFCVRPENYGRKVVRREVPVVLDEIRHLHTSRGVTHFRIEDSTPPRRALTELAQAIAASDLKGRVTFSAFSRIDMNREENFELMKEAGFISLFFGLESLDDDVLVRLRKGITYEAASQTLRKAHDAGIRTVGSFIFPTPGETRRSMETTLKRIGELNTCLDSVVVLPAGAYPSTEWGKHPEQFDIRLADDYIQQALIYPIKYLVPIHLWKPLPFSYRLLGKGAESVTFADIVKVQGEFVGTIRETYRIPGVPDYYFLIAHLLGRQPAEVSQEIVTCMIERDYARLDRLFNAPASGAPA